MIYIYRERPKFELYQLKCALLMVNNNVYHTKQNSTGGIPNPSPHKKKKKERS